MTAQAKYEVGSPVRATRPSAFGSVYEDGVVDEISRLGGGNRVLHIKFADGYIGRFHSDYITKFVSLRDTSPEERRNDPARKQAIADLIASRQAAWTEAMAHLAAAEEALRAVGSMQDDALMGRSADALFLAGIKIRRDEKLFMKEPNDCYLGNRAAAGHPIGWTP
jgi:hypothetical protein